MHNSPESTEQGAKFPLTALSQELRNEPQYAQLGHTSRTLVRSDDLRVVLTVIAANASIPEHQAPGSASIQVLSGQLRLSLPAGPIELGAGELLVLQGGLHHDVVASSDAAFLQTLAWK
jgi:quercetin dioxygenase-like cupin family protein